MNIVLCSVCSSVLCKRRALSAFWPWLDFLLGQKGEKAENVLVSFAHCIQVDHTWPVLHVLLYQRCDSTLCICIIQILASVNTGKHIVKRYVFLIVYCVNRALKTKHDTPKYGLIFHASLVGQTTPKHKGKVCKSGISM